MTALMLVISTVETVSLNFSKYYHFVNMVIADTFEVFFHLFVDFKTNCPCLVSDC